LDDIVRWFFQLTKSKLMSEKNLNGGKNESL